MRAALAAALTMALAAVLPQGAAAHPNHGRTAPKEAMDPSGPSTLEQRNDILKTLYGRLAVAPSADVATPIAQSIEQLWNFSGSATADVLMSRSQTATQAGQHDLALKLLDTVVELQPDFAAAWNQRAYVYYLKNDYKRALGDLRRVLALESNHFKALEGLAEILSEIGEKKAAVEALKKLLAIYPQAPGVQQRYEELSREAEGQGI